MRKKIEVAKITFIQALREKAFLIVLLSSLLVALFIPVVGSLSMFEISNTVMGFVLSYVNLSVLIISSVIMMTVFQLDLERKTLQFILSLPISRGDYVIGRYMGFLSFGAVSTFSIVFILYPPLAYYIRSNPNFVNLSILYFMYGIFLLIELSILIAFALLFVSLSSKVVITMFGIFSVYITGHSIDDVVEFMSTHKGMGFTGFSEGVITIAKYVLPNLSVFDLKVNFVYGKGISAVSLILSAAYGILYSLLIVLLAVEIFKYKEIF
ncbi:MAG: ABC-2 transporter permease [candidate division WOR-3 bacterium]